MSAVNNQPLLCARDWTVIKAVGRALEMESEAHTAEVPTPSLLDLPDPILLAVLQHCTDDPCSLFSAARAHSRLHQAAVAALSSITTTITSQHHMDDLWLYLDNNARHVSSLSLTDSTAFAVYVCQLLPEVQLTSLKLEHFGLQLQHGDFLGVLVGAAAVAALKRLELKECCLHEGTDQQMLAANLSMLPTGLEHLSIDNVGTISGGYAYFGCAEVSASLLQQLPQLTCLRLLRQRLQGPHETTLTSLGFRTLQPLQALTRLADLQLDVNSQLSVSADMLAGACHLTRLDVCNCWFDPGAVTGKTLLQHLDLSCVKLPDGATGTAQMLSQLQHLQQLTHLRLFDTLHFVEEGITPAAAFSVLTANSKLQNLDISRSNLPPGVWQHLFLPGKQLPLLKDLRLGNIRQPSNSVVAAPASSRLVSCCPNLQQLEIGGLQSSTELLAPLMDLSRLTLKGSPAP